MRNVEKGVRSQESGVGIAYVQRQRDSSRWRIEDSSQVRPPARTFEDLIVWQKAHAWVLSIYRLTESFPSGEKFALVTQFRRAAVSIPANIAEGFRKTGIADKKRFMNIAQGSLEECRYYLILAQDLGYADCTSELGRLQEVSRLLDAYVKAIHVPGILTPDS